MKISYSARSAIETLMRGSEPGSVPSLLLGYQYDESWQRIPVVEIACLPPDMVETMSMDYAKFNDQLLQEHDGVTFAVILSDDSGILASRLLTYTDAGFDLKLG